MSVSKRFEKRFINALLRLRPRNINQDDFLRHVMSVDSRIITLYKAKRTFDLPGLYCDDEIPDRARLVMAHESRRLRGVRRGMVVAGRVDDNNPNEIILEKPGAVLKLTRAEWDDVKDDFTLMGNGEPL